MTGMTTLPSFRLDGQVALVTGANRGIGAGLAAALGEAGASVILAGRVEAELRGVADGIPGSSTLTLDLADVASIRAAVARAEEQHGRIDILVNNAGLGANHPALEVTEDDWDSMMDVNLKGLFFASQAVARGMVERGHGRIVHLSSQASVVGIVDHAVYCASKGGVNQLTRVMALEWSRFGVTTNAVGPTFTYTPGTAERLDDPAYRDAVLDRIPAHRLADISDVAGAVVYLASDAARLVTGTVLLVDGGWTAQ